jgi:hypothetical protein
MTMLADISSFLGSVWFAGLTFLLGYVVGHVVPIHTILRKK